MWERLVFREAPEAWNELKLQAWLVPPASPALTSVIQKQLGCGVQSVPVPPVLGHIGQSLAFTCNASTPCGVQVLMWSRQFRVTMSDLPH